MVWPITDVLDLHLFAPRQIPALLDDYLDECLKRSIGSVRLIHGKGTGVLRERVHRLLRKDKRVAGFCLAPPEAGGWGATVVDLKAPDPASEQHGEVRVTAAVLIHQDKVLVARRPPGDPLAGQWEFPGGKIEDGETPEQCLAREMNEEFGITVRVGAFLGSSRHAGGAKTIHLLAYEVFWDGGQLVSTSHSQWAFVTPSRLSAVDLAPADRPIARIVMQRLAANDRQNGL